MTTHSNGLDMLYSPVTIITRKSEIEVLLLPNKYFKIQISSQRGHVTTHSNGLDALYSPVLIITRKSEIEVKVICVRSSLEVKVMSVRSSLEVKVNVCGAV